VILVADDASSIEGSGPIRHRSSAHVVRGSWIAAAPLLLAVAGTIARADDAARTEIYGFARLDMGYQSGQSDPAWPDVLRPTKLPSFANEYGADGRFFAGVRDSRLGVKSFVPTDHGGLRTIVEFDLLGVGVDAGRTTFRLRHAYGELGEFGAGQTWSPFMDSDVFPGSLEIWGPNALVSFRNVQVRWMPLRGDTRLTFALERPGASGDAGDYADRGEREDVQTRFPLPDLSAEYRAAASWGYVELAGILRHIEWDDLGTDEVDLSGDALGWGLNLSSNVELGASDTLHLQFVYGEGIQNYMNDAPADIGIEPGEGGVALPLYGVVAFLDHTWNEQFSSSLGFSHLDIDNSEGQAASAFHIGQYALGNLLYHPVPDTMVGLEVQWGRRENFEDGFDSDDLRVQFAAKDSFSSRIGV